MLIFIEILHQFHKPPGIKIPGGLCYQSESDEFLYFTLTPNLCSVPYALNIH